MPPVRSDFGQGPHYEQPLMRTRMRQGQLGRCHDDSPLVDEIQVKRAIRIPGAPDATEAGLNAEKPPNRIHGIDRRLDNRDPIAILISRRVRPGGRTPPAGPAQNRQSRLREERQSGLEQIHRRSVIAGQIGPQRHDGPDGPPGDDARLRKTLTQ